MYVHLSGKPYLERQQTQYRRGKWELPLKTPLEQIRLAEAKGCLFHGARGSKKRLKLEAMHTPIDSNRVVTAGKPWVALSKLGRPGAAGNDIKVGVVDKTPFLKADAATIEKVYGAGGYLYLVDPGHFTISPNLPKHEFVARQDVVPLRAIFIEDPISLMRELGVEVVLE